MLPLQEIGAPDTDMPFENQSVVWKVPRQLSTLQA